MPGFIGLGKKLDAYVAHIHQKFSYILFHVRDGAELLCNALDEDGGDGCTAQRTKEHAPDAVAQNYAKTFLHRLGNEFAVILTVFGTFNFW